MVKVVADFKIDQKQKDAYIAAVKDKMKEVGHDARDLKEIHLSLREDGDVSVDYFAPEGSFERIRRITGYLTGTVDRWNEGKQAELKDRVKHA